MKRYIKASTRDYLSQHEIKFNRYHNQFKSKPSDEYFSKPGYDGPYWYRTTHGVGPGSVPKGLETFDIVEAPYGVVFFNTDVVLTTESLKRYDILEEVPTQEFLEKYDDRF